MDKQSRFLLAARPTVFRRNKALVSGLSRKRAEATIFNLKSIAIVSAAAAADSPPPV